MIINIDIDLIQPFEAQIGPLCGRGAGWVSFWGAVMLIAMQCVFAPCLQANNIPGGQFASYNN